MYMVVLAIIICSYSLPPSAMLFVLLFFGLAAYPWHHVIILVQITQLMLNISTQKQPSCTAWLFLSGFHFFLYFQKLNPVLFTGI